MNRPAIPFCLPLAILVVSLFTGTARAQEWSVDVAAGQTTFDPVSANVETSNLMGGVRYDAMSPRWVYGAVAAPLRAQDVFWAAAGTGGRFVLAGSETRGVSTGAELGGHGFAFRDPVAAQIGTGGTIEVVPFASVVAGAIRVDLRGGWRGHALSDAQGTVRRTVVEGGARVAYGSALRVGAETRWVRSDGASYPFVGTSLRYGGHTLRWWAQVGKWMSDSLDEMTWGAGAAIALNSRASVWTSLRQEAPDPLYWNAARRTWTVGFSTRLGRAPAMPLPNLRTEAGRVVIRVPVDEASTPDLWIAGSFNHWQPMRMERERDYWTIAIPLAPGVYRYAFRSGTGHWFVPASIAGRRDDGMGGHVAVLVVS
jgi:hypothetical protein